MQRRPSIAILGAGPTGLEAALAARESGTPFRVFESSRDVAGYVREWGHVRLFSPWSLDVSPRARRALEAAGVELPDAESRECPTGRELFERIFRPVSELPGIAENIVTETRVLSIGRERYLKNDEIGTGRRSEQRFRLLVEDADGEQRTELADVVIDCTGTYGHPNALGAGGIEAPGERAAGDRVVRAIPDFDREADEWSGRELLLVGGGHSAQTAVVALARLAEQHEGTKIYWSLRSAEPSWHVDPDDPLPERRDLTERARALAGGTSPAVEVIAGTVVDAVAPDGARTTVTLQTSDGSQRSLSVDRILALTGAVGDHTLYRQLQVHECYATSGPMNLAAALLGSGGDCLAQVSHGLDSLTNPEPNFYILGSKSYGRNTTFLMRAGWDQVSDVFEGLEERTKSSEHAAQAS